MAVLRNVVVHDDVDLAVVADVVDNHPGDLVAFVKAVRRVANDRRDGR